MPKVTHVKKAQKAQPEHDIKVGDSYYWWKFRHGGVRVSKTPPKRSQLTQSSFYSAVYDLEDNTISNAAADGTLPDVRDEVVSALEDLKSECESSLENIPDSLKDAPVGALLQERIDALENAISEFGDLDLDEPSFSADKGSEVLIEQKIEGVCEQCNESEHHTVDCVLSLNEEAIDADGLTEKEATTAYWEEKLEEFSNISIEAP